MFSSLRQLPRPPRRVRRFGPVIVFLAATGYSESEPPVSNSCESIETCAEIVCPDLCENWGEVTVANGDRRYSTDDEPGECYCLCEDERGRDTCCAQFP